MGMVGGLVGDDGGHDNGTASPWRCSEKGSGMGMGWGGARPANSTKPYRTAWWGSPATRYTCVTAPSTLLPRHPWCMLGLASEL